MSESKVKGSEKTNGDTGMVKRVKENGTKKENGYVFSGFMKVLVDLFNKQNAMVGTNGRLMHRPFQGSRNGKFMANRRQQLKRNRRSKMPKNAR